MPWVPSTCTQEGSGRYRCTICGLEKEDAVPIDPDGHKWLHVHTTPATCVSRPIKQLWCAYCHATTEVEDEEGEIDPENHNWAYDRILVAPTCTEDGSYQEACTRCGATREMLFPALGHEWVLPSYTWADDNSTVTAKHICLHDESHVETETVDTVVEILEAPTCTEAGRRKFTATFTKEGFETQTRVRPIPVIPHEWGEPTYTWSSDNRRVTAKRVCAYDAEETHTETETVRAAIEDDPPATCTEPGIRTYTATFSNPAFTAQEKQMTIPATGHKWGEPTYEWAEDLSSVTATRVCANDPSHVETEKADTSAEITTAPTCTTGGVRTYTARFENEAFETQTRTQTVDALGHDWGDWTVTTAPTCTDQGIETRTCSRCGEKESREVAALGHDYVATVTPPTCTKMGYTTHACSRCQNSYTDTPVAALGHDYVATVTAPTCTEAGFTTHTCSRCRNSYTDTPVAALGHDWGDWAVTTPATETAKGEEARTCNRCGAKETRPIPELSHVHNLVMTAAVDATCTEPGNIAYYTCSGCGHRFRDEAGTVEIKPEDTVLPALGHDWGDWAVTTPATETEKGEEARTCNRCGAKDTRPIPELSHVHNLHMIAAVDATCTEPGNIAYYTCSDCGLLFRDSEGAERIDRDDVIVPAKGHTEVADAAVAPTCTETGLTAGKHCSVCGTVLEAQQVVPANGHTPGQPVEEKRVNATCLTAGSYDSVVYCTVCHGELSREAKTIDALGHSFGDWIQTKAPSCTEKGEDKRTCSRCNAEETREVDALGHALIHHDAKAQTCTTKGWDAYDTCSRCEYSTKVEKDPLGHDWSGTPTYTPVDAQDYSKVTRTCVCARNCGETGNTVSQTVNTTVQVTTPATCKADGEKTYTATFTDPVSGTWTGKLPYSDPDNHNMVKETLPPHWVNVNGEAARLYPGFTVEVCSRCGFEGTPTPIPIGFFLGNAKLSLSALQAQGQAQGYATLADCESAWLIEQLMPYTKLILPERSNSYIGVSDSNSNDSEGIYAKLSFNETTAITALENNSKLTLTIQVKDNNGEIGKDIYGNPGDFSSAPLEVTVTNCDHKWSDPVTVPHTDTEDGYINKRTCSKCNLEKWDEIIPAGHVWMANGDAYVEEDPEGIYQGYDINDQLQQKGKYTLTLSKIAGCAWHQQDPQYCEAEVPDEKQKLRVIVPDVYLDELKNEDLNRTLWDAIDVFGLEPHCEVPLKSDDTSVKPPYIALINLGTFSWPVGTQAEMQGIILRDLMDTLIDELDGSTGDGTRHYTLNFTPKQEYADDFEACSVSIIVMGKDPSKSPASHSLAKTGDSLEKKPDERGGESGKKQSTDKPTAEPIAKPTPEPFTGSVSVKLENEGDVYEGDELVFRAVVKGDKSLVTIHWQKEVENRKTHEKEWQTVETGERFRLAATAENLAEKYRVALFDAHDELVAEKKVTFPAVHEPTPKPTKKPKKGKKADPTPEPTPEPTKRPRKGKKG